MAGVVESLRSLHDCLKNRANVSIAEGCVYNITNYFEEELSNSEINAALAAVFEEGNGILSSIKKAIPLKTYKNAVVQAFCLLKILLGTYQERMSPFVENIKNACMMCISRSDTSVIEKEKAYESLHKLLETGSWSQILNINDLIKDLLYKQINYKPQPSILQKLYHILGTISHFYPENMNAHADTLLRLYFHELDKQGQLHKDVPSPVVSGCLEGLAEYLHTFSQPVEDSMECRQKVYSYIKLYISYTSNRKITQRSALKILHLHGILLRQLLYEDFVWWHNQLINWLHVQSNDDDKKWGKNALITFYEVISTTIQESTDEEHAKSVFKYFIDYFKGQLVSADKACIIQGLGKFSQSCIKYMSEENMQSLRTLLIQQAQQMYLPFEQLNEDTQWRLQTLPCYVESIANITLHLKCTETEVCNLQSMAVILIHLYGITPSKFQSPIIHALMSLLSSMASMQGLLFDIFIDAVIYQSLIRSCSSSKYEKYVSLWCIITDVQQSNDSQVPLIMKQGIDNKVYNTMISTIIQITKKLDLKVFHKTDYLLIDQDDPNLGLEARNPHDFKVFINLVEFCISWLRQTDNELFRKWVHSFAQCMIIESSKNPLVSGFYKLLSVCFCVGESISYFPNQESNNLENKSLLKLISKYLQQVHINIRNFKGDLQIACLYVFLESPVFFLPEISSYAVEIFQIAFKVGRSYLKLALQALTCLEKWKTCLASEIFTPILEVVLPELEPFLRNKYIDIGIDKELEFLQTSRRGRKQFSLGRKKLVEMPETELLQLQKQILQFLGPLDSNVALTLINSQNDRMCSWGQTKKLKLKMPFKGMDIFIYIDPLLPIVVDLSLHCSDRQTRVAACELLHAFIVFMLGTSKLVANVDYAEMSELFEKIFLPLIQLGCDSDEVVHQLFKPLVFQLAHWYSSPYQLRSKNTEIFVNVLLDCISHPSDSSLRDISAKCLGEFVEWSIKQHVSHRLEKSSVNIETIISRICMLCGHPSDSKRLGGALAFNSVYRVLRKDESIINEWFLELLYYMVKNLALLKFSAISGELSETEEAVEHVLRVLKERSPVFNKFSKQRHRPPEFNGVLLYDAVEWLFYQCRNENRNCRYKCMEIVSELAPLVDGCNSLDSFIQRFVKTKSHKKFLEIVESVKTKSVEPCSLAVYRTELEKSPTKVMQWLQLLQSALECYVWLFKNCSIGSVLLSDHDSKIICGIELFLMLCDQNNSVLDNIMKQSEMSVWEYDQFLQAKASVVLYIYDFILSSLSVQRELILPLISEKLFSSSFWHLISKSIFNSSLLGFDTRDDEVIVKLHYTLKNILCELQTNLESSVLNQLCKTLQDNCKNFITSLENDIKQMLQDSEFPLDLKAAILGIITVQESGLSLMEENDVSVFHKWLLRVLFEAVANISETQNTAVNLEPSSQSLGELLLRLVCLNEKQVPFLIDLLLDCTLLDCEGTRSLQHGEHFQSTFKRSVLMPLYIFPETALETLLDESAINKANCRAVTLVKQLSQFAMENRKTSGKLTQKFHLCLLEHWHTIESWATLNQENTSLAIFILKYLALCAERTSGCLAMHSSGKWVLSLLSNSSEECEISQVQCKALDLLQFLIPSPVNFPDDLKNAFQNLCQSFPEDTSELRPGTFQYDTFVLVFSKLLTALQITGNLYLLERIIALSVRDDNHICGETIQKALSLFVDRLNCELQCKAIEVGYTIFMETGLYSPQIRMNCMQNFVIPLIKFSHEDTVIQFFTLHLQQLFDLLAKPIESSRIIQIEHNLVSRIGCWWMVETLFSLVPTERLESTECPITKHLKFKKGLVSDLSVKAFNTRIESVSNLYMENFSVNMLFRKMQCAAYTFLIILLTSTKKELKFYTGLIFKEDGNRTWWDKIVDCTQTYSFPVCWDQIPRQRKRLVGIRQSTQREVQYLATDTQILVNSTLAEDVTRFDLTTSVYQSPASGKSMPQNCCVEISLEDDAINKHECMYVLCGLLRHMAQNNLYVIPLLGNPTPDFPSWMEQMRKSLVDKSKHPNIRIFLTKLIMNNVNIFKPFASYWLYPLMQIVVDGCLGYDINYMVSDVVSMLVSWHDVAIPSANESEKMLASEILEFLISNAPSQRRDVLKYNVDIIRTVVQVWKNCLHIPYQKLLEMFNVSNQDDYCRFESGIHITSIFLANGMQPWNDMGKQPFFKSLLFCISPSNKLLSLSSEVVGMCLKHLDPNHQDDVLEENADIFSLIKQKIYNLEKNTDKYLHCLHSIQRHYPFILDDFLKVALYHLTKVHGKFKVMCMEMICARVEKLGDFAFSELESKGLFTLLQHGDSDMQQVILLLIKKMLPQLPNNKQELVINECVNLSSVKSSSCRMAVFKVLMLASDQRVLSDNGISVLLKGLMDSDSDIREMIFEFWNDKKRLPFIMPDRFLNLLQSMYSSETEQHFLSYALHLLLDQEMFGSEYNSNVFPYPLTQCDFKQLQILVSERRQRSSLVPLFSQLPGTSQMTQYSTIPSQFQIKKSQVTLGFQPTIDVSKQETVSTISSSLMFTIGSGTVHTAQSSYNSKINESSEQGKELSTYVKSNRLFKHVKDVSRKFAFYETKRAARRQHLQEERVAKREMNVSLYRTYRTGDFPDIEIPYSSIFTPLQVLSKHNVSVAQQMMRLLFSGIVAELPESKSSIFLKTVTEIVYKVMKETKGTPTLVGSIFEIILSSDKTISLNADIVSSVSQKSGLLILGSLVLEKTLMDLKLQSEKTIDEYSCWLRLGELYQELEEWDVVHGVFHQKLNCCNDAKLALEAESEGNWKDARDYYANAIDKSNDPDNLKDYYHESYYECLSNLSDWKQLSQYVDVQVDGNWELLWSNAWNKQHLLPQLLMSKIQLIGLEDSSLFLRNLQFWLQDQINAEYLETHFTEELAVLCAIEQNFVKARVFINNCYVQFLNDWINMNTIGFKQRALALRDLHRLSELQVYLDFVCSTNVTKDVKQLESFWKKSKPKALSSLLDWDRKLAWRSQFIMYVKEKFPNNSQIWEHIEIETQLAMVEAALGQNNFSVAKKYLKTSEKKRATMPMKLKLQWTIGLSKCHWLKALQTPDETIKLETMIKACNSLHDPDPRSNEGWNDDWCLQLEACELMGMMAKGIWGVLKLYPEALSNIDEDLRNELLKWLGSSNSGRDAVMVDIQGCGSNYLHTAVEIALQQVTQNESQINKVSSTLANAYFKVAEFYDVTSINAIREMRFLEAILRAMKYGSKDAHYLFPRLLQNTHLEAEWIEKFIAESDEVAEWLFIKWISQILACLDKPIGQALHQLVVRVAKAYPQAMTWPFHISRGMYNLSDIPEDVLYKLDQLLLHDNLTETFLRAMSCMTQPEIILLHHVEKVLNACKQSMSSNETQRICEELSDKIKQIQSQSHDPVQGSLFDALNKYYPEVEQALKLIFEKATHGVEIFKNIKLQLEKRRQEMSSKKVPLQKYSPWLSDFQMSPWGNYLELPGQYTGECRPVPQYHTRIAGFLPEVRVIGSMRLPIKLTVIGNNAKEYSYLVKYGEDLRQDQRIQQLFNVMNIIFSKDRACLHRQINIITYQVIPLTCQLGIIEWINDTKTLKDLLEFNLNEEEQRSYKRAEIMCLDWLKLGSGHSESNLPMMHCTAYKNYTQEETVEAYKKRVDLIPWNVFRRAFMHISANQEEFFARRQKFACNYATMCISHWILGIGDRHLGNCLIREHDGSCIGIDFGCAFGCGIQFLPIPELMPFRMSPHILYLLQPFQSMGLVQGTMVHCMRTLRNASQILLATMEVFVHEPSINWIELAQRNKDFQKENDKWLPQEKLLIAKKKLDGANPVTVGSEELKTGHATSKFLNDYLKVLNGVRSLNIRARTREYGLSPSEQVECLIDLATDFHLLGKTWIGWEPWI